MIRLALYIGKADYLAPEAHVCLAVDWNAGKGLGISGSSRDRVSERWGLSWTQPWVDTAAPSRARDKQDVPSEAAAAKAEWLVERYAHQPPGVVEAAAGRETGCRPWVFAARPSLVSVVPGSQG